MPKSKSVDTFDLRGETELGYDYFNNLSKPSQSCLKSKKSDEIYFSRLYCEQSPRVDRRSFGTPVAPN